MFLNIMGGVDFRIAADEAVCLRDVVPQPISSSNLPRTALHRRILPPAYYGTISMLNRACSAYVDGYNIIYSIDTTHTYNQNPRTRFHSLLRGVEGCYGMAVSKSPMHMRAWGMRAYGVVTVPTHPPSLIQLVYMGSACGVIRVRQAGACRRQAGWLTRQVEMQVFSVLLLSALTSASKQEKLVKQASKQLHITKPQLYWPIRSNQICRIVLEVSSTGTAPLSGS
ncbi:hypothetical protein F4679DRAFT_145114 [Xylaria curta]|nr:hypothetical protein F4679DRAFT_145114 [Xylaria curta]